MSVKRISMGKEKITTKRKKALCGRISQKLCKTGIAAYICIVAALFGSFICGIYNLPIWYMLIFHSYTDIKRTTSTIKKEELEVKLLIYCWHMWMIELLMAAEPVYN